MFAGLLALMAYSGPARYSVDYYLEKKISWWWKVAEIRRPAQEQPVTQQPVPATPTITTEPVAGTPALPLAAGPAGPAGTPGTYRYLCPVPGHAKKGMAGTITVS